VKQGMAAEGLANTAIAQRLDVDVVSRRRKPFAEAGLAAAVLQAPRHLRRNVLILAEGSPPLGILESPAFARRCRSWGHGKRFGLSADAVVVLTEPQSCGSLLGPHRAPGRGM